MSSHSFLASNIKLRTYFHLNSNLFPTTTCRANSGSFSSNTLSATSAVMCPTSTTGRFPGRVVFIPKYRTERVNIRKTKSDRPQSTHTILPCASPHPPPSFSQFATNHWWPYDRNTTFLCCVRLWIADKYFIYQANHSPSTFNGRANLVDTKSLTF